MHNQRQFKVLSHVIPDFARRSSLSGGPGSTATLRFSLPQRQLRSSSDSCSPPSHSAARGPPLLRWSVAVSVCLYCSAMPYAVLAYAGAGNEGSGDGKTRPGEPISSRKAFSPCSWMRSSGPD